MASSNGKGDSLSPSTSYSGLPDSTSPSPSSETERSPLLSRPSYRQRALSRASGNPLPPGVGGGVDGIYTVSAAEQEAAEIERGKYLRRRRTKIGIVVVLGFLLVSGIVLAIVLPLTIGRRGRGKNNDDDGEGKDTPDFTRLPPPKPGLRNSNYLVNGWNGAVASEEERCSQIGVDGQFSLSLHLPPLALSTSPGSQANVDLPERIVRRRAHEEKGLRMHR